MTRRAAAIVLALCAAVGAGIGLPRLVPDRVLRAAISDPLTAVTGLPVMIDGPVSLSMWPRPHVTATRVILGDGEAPLLSAGRLDATIRLLPVLVGAVTPEHLRLEDVAINLPRDGQGVLRLPFDSGLLADLARADKPGGERQGWVLPRLEVINARLGPEVASPLAGLVLSDLDFHWPTAASPFEAEGEIVWRGRPVAVSVALDRPDTLLAGAASPVRLSLRGEAGEATLEDGMLDLSGGPQLVGIFSASGPSLGDVIAWAWPGAGDEADLREFDVRARLRADAAGVALDEMRLDLDDNEFDGALTLDRSGDRPRLAGTLASESLDLSPWAGGLALIEGPLRQWRRAPIDLAALASHDLDLRLSAAETRFGEETFGPSAVTVNLRAGALDLAVGEVAAWAGTLKGRLAITPRADGATAEVAATLAFAGVDVGRAMSRLAGFRRLDGIADGALDINGVGRSIPELLAGLGGAGHVRIADGALIGLDLASLLRELSRRPLSVSLRGHGGMTRFTAAGADVTIADGVALIDRGVLDGPDAAVRFDGTTALADRRLALDGVARLVGTEPFELPFTVRGRWDAPLVRADARALIRRSGAAAPLLNALGAENAAPP